jgi:adenylate kinase family enzyme
VYRVGKAIRRHRRRSVSGLPNIGIGAIALVAVVLAVVSAEGDAGERRRSWRSGTDTAMPANLGSISLANVRRVSIVGPAGSGKTTLAADWHDFRGLPYVKVDALQVVDDGTRVTPEEFLRRMEDVAGQESWILDGNVDISGVYRAADKAWSRADLVIWLDLPRHVLMRRLLVRTAVRALYRSALSEGIHQRWRDLFVFDPNRSVLAWTWFEQPRLRIAYELQVRDSRWAARVVRLRQPQEARRMSQQIRLVDEARPKHVG